jgi:hypothetical protein
MRAAEALVRYIRGLGLDNIPLLVFTFSIGETRYVEEFELTGSTTRERILYTFVNDLLHGSDSRAKWAKFNAK